MLGSARDLAKGLLGLGRKGNDKPQLLMWYPHSDSPPVGRTKEGYELRSYRDGDESAWAELLNDGGDLGIWTVARIEQELLKALLPGGQFFATMEETLIAGAGLYDGEKRGAACWEIGWVVTDPRHRGLGLARQVTAAAVAAALSQPPRPIFLMTDDFRIAAVKLYLKMGFAPDFDHDSYPHRWSRLGRELGPEYRQIIDRHLQTGAVA